MIRSRLAASLNVLFFEAPADFDFNRALFYSVMPGNSTSYNYGANSLLDVYKASVAFKAPADGFNISHIYTPINIESASNVTVRFDIVSGSDPETGEVIGSTDLFIPSQKNPSVGSFYLVPFDRAMVRRTATSSVAMTVAILRLFF